MFPCIKDRLSVKAVDQVSSSEPLDAMCYLRKGICYVLLKKGYLRVLLP